MSRLACRQALAFRLNMLHHPTKSAQNQPEASFHRPDALPAVQLCQSRESHT